MALDQQTLIARYQRGVSNGAQTYREGVTGKGTIWKTNATSDAAEARFAQGITRAVQNRSRQRGVAAVQSTDWETAASQLGAQNYAASATKAATNYSKIAQHVVAAAQASQNAAAAVAGVTMADRLNKSREAAIAQHRYWAQVNGEQPEI